MNKPTFLQIFITLVKRLFLINLISSSAFFNSVLFFFATLTIFNIAIGPTQLPTDVAFGIIYCTLCFTLILSSENIFNQDFESGIIQEFIATGVDKYSLLSSYYSAFSIINVLALTILFPTAYIILGISFDHFYHNIVSAILCVLIISLLLLLLKLISHNLNSSHLLMILIAPFLIPIMIIAIVSVNNFSYCLLLLGIFLVMLPITFFLSKLLLEEHL